LFDQRKMVIALYRLEIERLKKPRVASLAGSSKMASFEDTIRKIQYAQGEEGLFAKDGKVLLFRESKKVSGRWELPGGGLDFGEDIREGLKREVMEESGMRVTKVSRMPAYAWTHRFENHRGMDWFYSLVLAYRMELENFEFKINDECEEIGFFSKEELNHINLSEQTEELKKFFDPKDFISKEI